MNISITRKDAAAAMAAFRKVKKMFAPFCKIGDMYADRDSFEILYNTLRTFDDDTHTIEMNDNKVTISYGTFKGSFMVDHHPTGQEIFLNHSIIQNSNKMDTNTIFANLQTARQQKQMKTFVKQVKDTYNIDLSVQGIRSTGHHEGQVYNKFAAFERYAKQEKPQRDTEPREKPQSAPKQQTSRVTDPAPSSKQVEERAEAAQNALLQLVNNLNMLNEDKVIQLIKEHTGPQNINVDNLIDLIKEHSAPQTHIHLNGVQEVTKIEGLTHPKFETIMMNFAAGTNAFIYGPAGSGKSYTAMQAAKALNLPFYSISLCAQTTEARIAGYMNANGNYVETDFYRAYVNGGVFCLDEIDNGNANVLAVLNAALSGNTYGFPCGIKEVHKDFRVVATANTIGNGATAQYLGRNPLDKSTTDRFCFVPYDYDPALELMMCNNRKDIYNMVVNARNLLKDTKAVVSPRATAAIYKLTSVGMSIADAFDLAVTNKLTDNEKQILC